MKHFYHLIFAVAILVTACTENPAELPSPPQKKPADFEIVVTNKTTLSYTVDILPADKEMQYIFFTMTGKRFQDLGLDSHEDIIAYDLENFIAEAEAFEVTVEELLYDYYINVGDTSDRTITGIAPGDEFVVYVYGISIKDGLPVPTTDLVLLRDTTLPSTPIEQSMAVTTDINGTSVGLCFDPLTYTGCYFAFVEPIASRVSSPNPTEEELQEAAMGMWYEIISTYMSFGFSLELILENFTHKDVFSTTESLDPHTKYFAAAVPIDPTGVVYAYPTIKTFETGEVGKSENILTISIIDLKPRVATVSVKTTNNDPYLLACFEKEYFLGMSDDEIINYYLTNINSDALIYGDIDEFPMTGLNPNTEYFFAAFGYQAGVTTTQLYTCDFTTPEEVFADIQVKLNYIGHFDTKEVAALNSDYESYTGYDAIFTWEVQTTPQAESIYRSLYKKEMLEGIDDETLKENLLQGIPKTTFQVRNFVAYNYEYVMCAVAVDANGNVSRVFRSEPISVTYDTRGDAQEFLNNTHPSSAVQYSFEIPVSEPIVIS